MRKSKDINYWIHFSYKTTDGLEIRSSVVCDCYNEVFGKVVTESHDSFNDEIVRSVIIPNKLIDKIILYDKKGKEVDTIVFKNS